MLAERPSTRQERKVSCFLAQLKQTTDHTESGNNSTKWKERKWRITFLSPPPPPPSSFHTQTTIKGLNRFFHYFALTRSLQKVFSLSFHFYFVRPQILTELTKLEEKFYRKQSEREMPWVFPGFSLGSFWTAAVSALVSLT